MSSSNTDPTHRDGETPLNKATVAQLQTNPAPLKTQFHDPSPALPHHHQTTSSPTVQGGAAPRSQVTSRAGVVLNNRMRAPEHEVRGTKSLLPRKQVESALVRGTGSTAARTRTEAEVDGSGRRKTTTTRNMEGKGIRQKHGTIEEKVDAMQAVTKNVKAEAMRDSFRNVDITDARQHPGSRRYDSRFGRLKVFSEEHI